MLHIKANQNNLTSAELVRQIDRLEARIAPRRQNARLMAQTIAVPNLYAVNAILYFTVPITAPLFRLFRRFVVVSDPPDAVGCVDNVAPRGDFVAGVDGDNSALASDVFDLLGCETGAACDDTDCFIGPSAKGLGWLSVVRISSTMPKPSI